MTRYETAHAVFTVALFCLVFRSAGGPVGVTVAGMAFGLLIVGFTDRLIIRHAPR